MNNTTELNLNEMEKVNGGWWWIGVLAVGALIGVIHEATSD